MQEDSIRALLVEDSPTDAQLFQHVFFRAATSDWNLRHVERLEDALDCAATEAFDVALLDLRLPDSDGLDTIARFCQANPDIPVIILTVMDDEELALQAMAKGAQDYLVKDQVTTQLLRRSIRYAIERTQILKQLKESERATLRALDTERELNHLKSHFIAMVSHEFRNPLSALRVVSEMLLRYQDQLTPEKKATYFGQISMNIDHMCQLLDEVIFLGKAETGNCQLELQSLNLLEFCQDLISFLEFSDNQQHPIQLTFQLDAPQVSLDPALLKHILVNLLSNALKYSPAGSEVKLDVNCCKDAILFAIQDQGIGIPEAERHRLFETFNRCSNVGHVPGTGLGLAIVKRCLDLHGGTIVIESQINQGTTVTMALPIHQPASELQPPSSACI